MSSEQKIQELIKLARSLLGTSYKYGATMAEAPSFFDCSGFIKYVFGKVGIELPRSTIEQAVEGEEVKMEGLKPGDLIFAHGTHGHYNPRFPQGIGHVGVYTPDNTVIHAASKRISEKPIIEEGSVVEQSLDEYITGWAPIVIVRRIVE